MCNFSLAAFKIFLLSLIFFFNMYVCMYWEREGMRWRGTERERQSPKQAPGSRLRAVSTEPGVGLELTNCEIVTWAELGLLTDWATQALLDFLDWYVYVYVYIFLFQLLSCWKLLTFIICFMCPRNICHLVRKCYGKRSSTRELGSDTVAHEVLKPINNIKWEKECKLRLGIE